MSSLFRAIRFSPIVALAAAGLAFGLPSAKAQGVRCAERAMVVASLTRNYQETQTALGITLQGNLVEVFVSPSGSWTILHTSPSGVACIMAAGEAWAEKDKTEEGPLA